MRTVSSKNVDHAIGQRLATVRQRLNLSQGEMAARVGVSLRAYQSYERGEREISASALRALYQKLGVSPVWVLVGGDDGAAPLGKKSENGQTAEIDMGVFLAVLNEVEDRARVHSRAARSDELSPTELARLAIVVYNRVVRLGPAEQGMEIAKEVKRVFEILTARNSTDVRARPLGKKLQRLLNEWIELETASMRAFAELTTLEMPDFGKYVAADIGDEKTAREHARWKLRERLLVEGLIAYEPSSAERFIPLNDTKCVAWLDDQCKKLRAHLEFLTREISTHRARAKRRHG